MTPYPALPGYYKFLFLYLEPISEVGPFVMCMKEGASWFYNELVPPTGPPPTHLDPRAEIAIWQLAVGFLLLFFLTSLGFRAVRDSLQDKLDLQEKVTGTILFCLGIADVTHFTLTYIFLPEEWKYNPLMWNTTTHGNLSFVILLHTSRICWFLGVGRKRYYFGQPAIQDAEHKVEAKKAKLT
jgi:amino acid transporter